MRQRQDKDGATQDYRATDACIDRDPEAHGQLRARDLSRPAARPSLIDHCSRICGGSSRSATIAMISNASNSLLIAGKALTLPSAVRIVAALDSAPMVDCASLATIMARPLA